MKVLCLQVQYDIADQMYMKDHFDQIKQKIILFAAKVFPLKISWKKFEKRMVVCKKTRSNLRQNTIFKPWTKP